MELSYGATFEPKAKFGAVQNGHVMRRRRYKRDLDLDWEIGREECWVETLVYGSFYISGGIFNELDGARCFRSTFVTFKECGDEDPDWEFARQWRPSFRLPRIG